MIKAIIFDCFGVLVGRGFEETYTVAGGDHKKDREFIEETLHRANSGQMTHDEFHEAMAGKIGVTADEFKTAAKKAEQPNYELLEYIITLKKKYKTAVLSNVNTGILERKIGKEWLEKCFDVWIASAEVGYIKPEREIYHHTAEQLGVEASECVFTDDREGYVQAAEAEGMKGIVYRDFEQLKRELEAILSGGG